MSETGQATRFEGYDLPAFLTAQDIHTLLGGIVARRTVVRWFATGQLKGFRPGRSWVIRATQFVSDWEALERSTPGLRRGRVRVVDAPALRRRAHLGASDKVNQR